MLMNMQPFTEIEFAVNLPVNCIALIRRFWSCFVLVFYLFFQIMGRQWPQAKSNPPPIFYKAFYIFKQLKKTQKKNNVMTPKQSVKFRFHIMPKTNFIGTQPCPFIYILFMVLFGCFWHYSSRVEPLWQRCYDLQSLMFLLFGLLEEKFANSCFKSWKYMEALSGSCI